MALGENLKFYTSLSKGLKLTVRKFWGLIPTFVEVTGEKLVGGLFAPPPLLSWIGLTLIMRIRLQAVSHTIENFSRNSGVRALLLVKLQTDCSE